MREIQRDIVSAVLIRIDQRVLLGRKDPIGGGVYPDCWQIPGGGIEAGEDQIQALQREMREEIGTEIKDWPVTLLSDNDSASATRLLDSGEKVLCHMKFFVYLIRIPDRQTQIAVQAGSDLIEIGWFTLGQIRTMKIPPTGVRLFEEFGKQIFQPVEKS